MVILDYQETDGVFGVRACLSKMQIMQFGDYSAIQPDLLSGNVACSILHVGHI